MKKHLLLMATCLAILVSASAATPDNINKNFGKISATEKAMKSFHHQYENISGEVWKQIENGYEASFEIDGNTTKAFYSNKGNWVYTVEYFKASYLPASLIQQVQQEYDKYYIAGAEKIDAPAGSAYIVHLENKNFYKTISINENGSKLLNEFRKTK